MYVCPQLKLNKLVHVVIPKAIDLFARFGISAVRSSLYSGDNFIPQESKLDTIHRMSRIDKDALDAETYQAYKDSLPAENPTETSENV